mmetsp:Transcript_16165/g.56443  ORF Transcript_16165/g.56443 Transcript_16165/m.56443 type:complete len:203 (-) Transcript_16165:146-754(-)
MPTSDSSGCPLHAACSFAIYSMVAKSTSYEVSPRPASVAAVPAVRPAVSATLLSRKTPIMSLAERQKHPPRMKVGSLSSLRQLRKVPAQRPCRNRDTRRSVLELQQRLLLLRKGASTQWQELPSRRRPRRGRAVLRKHPGGPVRRRPGASRRTRAALQRMVPSAPKASVPLRVRPTPPAEAMPRRRVQRAARKLFGRSGRRS